MSTNWKFDSIWVQIWYLIQYDPKFVIWFQTTPNSKFAVIRPQIFNLTRYELKLVIWSKLTPYLKFDQIWPKTRYLIQYDLFWELDQIWPKICNLTTLSEFTDHRTSFYIIFICINLRGLGLFPEEECRTITW